MFTKYFNDSLPDREEFYFFQNGAFSYFHGDVWFYQNKRFPGLNKKVMLNTHQYFISHRDSLKTQDTDIEGVFRVIDIVIGNGIGDPSSNPELDCISPHARVLRKGMNPSVILPVMGK